MFAIMRHIPYTRHYLAWKIKNSKGNAEVGTSLDAGALPIGAGKVPIDTEDAEQVFLTDEQFTEAASFKERIIKTVKDTVYNPQLFLAEERHLDWPLEWVYPRDPSFPGISDEPSYWIQCISCSLPVMAGRMNLIEPEESRCTCKFSKIVLLQPRPCKELLFLPFPFSSLFLLPARFRLLNFEDIQY